MRESKREREREGERERAQNVITQGLKFRATAYVLLQSILGKLHSHVKND